MGVVIDSKLSFSEHVGEKVSKANRIVGLIRRTFVSLDEKMFKPLYVALVRPHLEYANQAWSPYLSKDIVPIENVQRRATKLIPSLKEMSYEDRLRKLKLPTLAYRRARGDMIETYKILSGVYDPEVCKNLFVLREESVTRGHDKKIYKERSRINKRKFSFCNRVVDLWNGLPQCVVEAESVREFESKLDFVWKNQELLYNFKSKIKLKDIISSTNTNHSSANSMELESQA